MWKRECVREKEIAIECMFSTFFVSVDIRACNDKESRQHSRACQKILLLSCFATLTLYKSGPRCAFASHCGSAAVTQLMYSFFV